MISCLNCSAVSIKEHCGAAGLNVKQRHIKCESLRHMSSRVLYSEMVTNVDVKQQQPNDFLPGGGVYYTPACEETEYYARTIGCDIPLLLSSLKSLSLPLPNNVTLPLWPIPFQILVLSGKKQINITNIYFIP